MRKALSKLALGHFFMPFWALDNMARNAKCGQVCHWSLVIGRLAGAGLICVWNGHGRGRAAGRGTYGGRFKLSLVIIFIITEKSVRVRNIQLAVALALWRFRFVVARRLSCQGWGLTASSAPEREAEGRVLGW